jgi:hypothetical protein
MNMSISRLCLISLTCTFVLFAGCDGDSKNVAQDEHRDAVPQRIHPPIDSIAPRINADLADSGDTHPTAEKKPKEPQYPSREWQIKQKLERQRSNPAPILGLPDVDTVRNQKK